MLKAIFAQRWVLAQKPTEFEELWFSPSPFVVYHSQRVPGRGNIAGLHLPFPDASTQRCSWKPLNSKTRSSIRWMLAPSVRSSSIEPFPSPFTLLMRVQIKSWLDLWAWGVITELPYLNNVGIPKSPGYPMSHARCSCTQQSKIVCNCASKCWR